MRFDMICEANVTEHRLTKPNHPWSEAGQKTIRWIVFPPNGQVERMNRTIKDGTVKRLHYDSHDQLRTHLADFLAAYNFARRLKTLNGLTPYEYICKVWTSEPEKFIVNTIHQMPGLNTKKGENYRMIRSLRAFTAFELQARTPRHGLPSCGHARRAIRRWSHGTPAGRRSAVPRSHTRSRSRCGNARS